MSGFWGVDTEALRSMGFAYVRRAETLSHAAEQEHASSPDSIGGARGGSTLDTRPPRP